MVGEGVWSGRGWMVGRSRHVHVMGTASFLDLKSLPSEFNLFTTLLLLLLLTTPRCPYGAPM